MARLIVRIETKKDTCYNEIGLCLKQGHHPKFIGLGESIYVNA